jgi:transcriptional regulator with XRE-family HTH domain
MQICMKVTSHGKRLFLSDFAQRLKERGWSKSDLARNSGVHQSQVSRISSGDFKTFGSSLMQICMKLDLKPDRYYLRTRADRDREAIADSAIAIWDGSSRDRKALVSLLNQIARIRRS